MKKQPIYQIDAFSSELFGGNPAAVCPLSHWLSDDQMQSIAAENNLSETAFILPEDEHYQIRWFTPNTEVALCGHATLASAFVVFEFLGHKKEQIVFNSKSGELRVKKNASLLQMDFPALPYTKITPLPSLLKALKVRPVEVYESTFDLLIILENELDVKEARPDLYAISELNNRGVILSAPASQADVYSRCFYPGCDVPEDPVTGSAHCVIAPYWSSRLGKNKIHAIQGLKRKGELLCEVARDRVLLSGSCQLYLQGHIFLP
ncbi:TPA: PhzF family phenazine biosynthesis protein [Legionella pneumophila]|uniref:PhzF family phenazine biosynthesis protein n=1 Tax=Legionella lytica TaxID=96232 RepID=A0ABY4YEF5_9GAMM|nr:PhzF family phenazine biosynthesis protein [Legionella lytica]USQ15242.1 PhzF family phenazine biosynthesis protein [Legionella lytica]USQ15605.1 PhzF family phenazine biosynthesis protein [Legionella lytica]HAU0368120.1 PhzF family phenazine biosynthesis protein [Legionella pneumophila]HRD71029.1 PhzF family phenazine biosynthesis protein [Legionella sp.]